LEELTIFESTQYKEWNCHCLGRDIHWNEFMGTLYKPRPVINISSGKTEYENISMIDYDK